MRVVGIKTNISRRELPKKIDILKEYLPEYLVENKNVYGVVSMGIHSLSEANCKEYFPVLKNVIEISLNEIIAKQEAQRKKEETARQLGLIARQHKDKK